MKILYLIIASQDPVHINDEKCQQTTWRNYEESEVIWLRGGNSTKYDLKAMTLYVEVEDTYINILRKTILGIQWCLANLNFDYIVRGNVSTYFNCASIDKKLARFVSCEPFFGGYIDFSKKNSEHGKEVEFINGGALFMNRETASMLSEMEVGEWEETPDDVAISQYLKSVGVKLKWIPRGNVGMTGILTSRSYYRMKSSANSSMASMRMKLLYAIHQEKNVIRKLFLWLKFQANEIMNFKRNFRSLQDYVLNVYSVVNSKVNSLRVSKPRKLI